MILVADLLVLQDLFNHNGCGIDSKLQFCKLCFVGLDIAFVALTMVVVS